MALVPRVRSRAEWLAIHLPKLLESLQTEREFRIHQLVELAPDLASVRDTGTGAGDEVTSLVVAGARRALEDIDRAMRAVGAGEYGYCEACSGEIPVEMLWSVPRTRLCPQCSREPTG